MGNILTLNRKSLGIVMDSLSYIYPANSNKLLSVTDHSGNIAGFKDGTNSGYDYDYDANGNLTTDYNKGLTISYNYLNLPSSVSNTSKSIDYTYDATGRKLIKTFDGYSHYYIDGIEYKSDTLIFAMTEEGRVRPIGNGSYTYDYFLKDHLGNVRVVLNPDNSNQSMVYPAATMETATSATENTYYSNLDKVRSFTPVGFKSLKKNEKVALLKGTDPNRQIGPSITIKVNSGDKISLTAQSFYPDNTGTQRTGLAETAISQLVNAMLHPTGLNETGKTIALDRLKNQGFDKTTSYQNMMNSLPNSDYTGENNRPKAYMVWMLFDKEMKLVKTGNSSGALQIPEGAGQVKQMAESNILMDQGGFLTAYTVNESPANVYIDNFQLSTISGNVLEINNYYPFGMLNEGLSDPGTTDPINNYKYNSKELQTDLSLQWLDYGHRFYDPQIARFHSIDLMADSSRRWSPYHYAANNPIRFIDIMGDSAWSVKRKWNESDIKGFAKYAEQRLKDFEGKEIDCADLALTVLIGYASENGLALQLSSANGKTIFDSNSDKYKNVKQFTSDVNGGLAANDISSNTFIVAKSDKQAGDIVIVTSPYHHIANYSSVNPNKLTYGNYYSRENKPGIVKTETDWSNSSQDGNHNKIVYYPDMKHVNRWNVLNFGSSSSSSKPIPGH